MFSYARVFRCHNLNVVVEHSLFVCEIRHVDQANVRTLQWRSIGEAADESMEFFEFFCV